MDQVQRNTGHLESIQHDALDLIPRFFKLIQEFRPVLIEWNPADPDTDFPSDLTIVGTTGYHQLKSLYVDGYELLCRGLTPVTGLININHRGDPDSYPPNPSNAKQSVFADSLVKFHRLPHGRKAGLLAEEPEMDGWLGNSLDSHLRNAIGHNTIEYDDRTSTVTFPVGHAGKNQRSISYGNFVLKVLRVLVRSHQMNQLVKICFIYKQATEDGKL